MKHEDIEARGHDLGTKFDYALTSLCFAALGLSYQFSPNMGTRMPDILILAWVLFLIAGCSGGWRLMNEPGFYRMNAGYVRLQAAIHRRKIELNDPRVRRSLAQSQILSSTDLEPLSEVELQKNLAEDERKELEARATLDKLVKKFPKIFNLQIYSFLGGMILNALFIASNYCSKAGCFLWIAC